MTRSFHWGRRVDTILRRTFWQRCIVENSLPLRYAERTGSDDAPARMNLILSCTARSGIIAATTRVMADLDCNILESGQYIDEADNRFFMRLSFRAPAGASKDRLETGLWRVAEQFGMTTELRPAGRRTRMIVMVSRFDHSLVHLLYQIRVGWLAADVVAIVSNHEAARDTAEMYGIPYYCWPVTPASKAEQEARLRDLYASSGAELIVLARYMQVLSDDFSSPLFGRIINIHHSFLPSFKGGKPYHQAFDRGVKLIGATAHYVTADLDEGPIIEQETQRVTHAMSAEDFVAIGRDIESVVLSRAVKLHVEQRVMINGKKCVVFGQ